MSVDASPRKRAAIADPEAREFLRKADPVLARLITPACPPALHGWRVYGAKRAQPVATDGKWLSSENGSNRPIRNP